MFSDSYATVEGSNNYPGAQSDVYDDLLAHVGKAESREALVTAMRALDRVERARLDWIPNWYSAEHKVAFWDMFGFPDTKPDYGWPVESLWWLDEDKARITLQGAHDRGIRAVAIAGLHAYLNPEHERRVADIAAEIGFTQITASHQVNRLAKLVVTVPNRVPIEVPLLAGADVERLSLFGRLGSALGYILWGQSG